MRLAAAPVPVLARRLCYEHSWSSFRSPSFNFPDLEEECSIQYSYLVLNAAGKPNDNNNSLDNGINDDDNSTEMTTRLKVCVKGVR
jgi:hypothetical protein